MTMPLALSNGKRHFRFVNENITEVDSVEGIMVKLTAFGE